MLILSVAALAAAPLLAVFDPTLEELEQNRQKLEKWRAEPRRFARLRHDLRDFLALPDEDRRRLRKLDYLLHQEKPATQTRLYEVMERYADWLERLPAAERQQLRALRDWRQRLDRIRQIRQEEWIARLPQAVRERLKKTQGAERDRLIAALQKQHRQRRQEWRTAFEHWDELLKKRPAGIRQRDLPAAMKVFVEEYLRPRLSPEEKNRLDKVADKPARFPKVLVELANRHPLALPGPWGPTHFEELPRDVQKLLKEPTDGMRQAEGKWPRYAVAVVEAAQSRKVRLPIEFWPSQYGDLSGPVQQFLHKKLEPLLTHQEVGQILKSRGKWPAYPLAIESAARKHGLQVPWKTLPEPFQQRLNALRGKARAIGPLPDVPRKLLRDFVFLELTPKERAELHLSDADGTLWERVKLEYFKRKPQELKRWSQTGRKKKGKGKAK
jgi:hypothetical protein